MCKNVFKSLSEANMKLQRPNESNQVDRETLSEETQRGTLQTVKLKISSGFESFGC